MYVTQKLPYFSNGLGTFGGNGRLIANSAADVPVEEIAGGYFEAGLRRPTLIAPVRNGQRGREEIYFKVRHPTDYTLVKGEKKRYDRYYRGWDLVSNGWAQPMVLNATGLRKEEWLHLDANVLRAARYEMRVSADLEAANTYGGFNGMGKVVLESEAMNDPGEAIVDMDGVTPGRNDAPLFQLRGLPLPITHCDFHFTARKLQISRNSGTPLDATMGEAAGRRVGEMLERTTLGNEVGMTYGGNSTQVGGYDMASTVWGYTTHPDRLTKTNMTVPNGTNAQTTLSEVIACMNQLRANKFRGPFMIYTSTDWDDWLDTDYILTGGNVATQSLRNRIKAIGGVLDIQRADFLRGTLNATPDVGEPSRANRYTMIFVQFTPDVARMVNGMGLTTLQWETVGGMRLNFKVMCIKVPQIRSDYYHKMGVLQAVTSPSDL